MDKQINYEEQDIMAEISLDWADLRFNDPRRIPIGKCQQNLFDIVKQVQKSKTRRLITKEGIVVAAICPLQEVAKLDEYLERKEIVLNE